MPSSLALSAQMIRPVMKLPQLEKWIAEELRKVTRREIPRKQRRIRLLLWIAYFGRRPHRAPPLHCRPPQLTQFKYIALGTSFAAKFLHRDLGGSSNKYHKYIDPYFWYPSKNKGKSRRLSKCYNLKEEAEQKLTDIWRNGLDGFIYDDKNNRTLTVADLPQNGVLHSTHSSIAVPSLLTFDLNQVERCIEEQEVLLDALRKKAGFGFGQYRRMTYQVRRLYEVRVWIRQFGGLQNLYRDSRNGRLTGIGQGHLQTIQRPVRRSLLAGSGWWDYDFKNCHYNITRALCRRYGFPTPILEDYLNNKQEIDRDLVDEFQLPTGTSKIKRLMLAVLNDQPITSSPFASLVKTVGQHAVPFVKDSKFIKDFRRELKMIRSKIIQQHFHSHDGVINAVGKIIGTTYKDKKTAQIKITPPRKLFSHILMGYEAWALNTVLSRASNTAVLVYDGWIATTPQDIGKLEEHLRLISEQELGFPLLLPIKEERF